MKKNHLPIERKMYSVDELAVAWGISRSLAYRLVKSGEVPSIRLGGRRIVIPAAVVDAMVGNIVVNQ